MLPWYAPLGSFDVLNVRLHCKRKVLEKASDPINGMPTLTEHGEPLLFYTIKYIFFLLANLKLHLFCKTLVTYSVVPPCMLLTGVASTFHLQRGIEQVF